jgi:acetyl-CoA carboxylase biotin carboxylase subunit
MGVETVAVASEADIDSRWLQDATEVVCIGPAKASQSYLDQDVLIEVARQKRCAAVHPGWGFLSENAEFALRCESVGITFIGPASSHLEKMGDKAIARKTMKDLGMPIIPGTDGALKNVDEAKTHADKMGYPVMVKAVSGGGGRGMRIVRDAQSLHDAYEAASAEALSCFGDGSLYLEKCIENGRHVEVQILADHYGHCIHLGERECSIQRRHQKVVEEAPSPGLSDAERERILPLVADVVARSGYRNAGTVEMLLAQDGKLYFMEMNTRLQVEHSVTEANTGIDLVEWQLRIAANEPLLLKQADIVVTGHSVEFRINAEDPSRNFRPCPGRVEGLRFPAGKGIRVDTHLSKGDVISPHYDSMVAKLIVSGATRAACLEASREALKGVAVEGVITNVDMLTDMLEWAPFVSGQYHTGSLETYLAGE